MILVAVALVQLGISVTLLLIASTRSDLPSWGGPLDVIIAFTLVGTGVLIWQRAGDRAGLREFRVGHGVAAIIPALMLAGDLVVPRIPRYERPAAGSRVASMARPLHDSVRFGFGLAA